MPGEKMLAVYVISGACAVVGVASTFPALTPTGATAMQGISQEKYEKAVVEEAAFCKANGGKNCNCIAQTAGTVRAYDTPRAIGATYMDQTRLARQQAKDRC